MQKTVFFILFFLLASVGSAQIKNKGIRFIKNYTSNDYPSLSLTWDILQDKRGIMYFATPNGLIEFDGNNWRTITLPNKSVIRSLRMDINGRIYIGAQVEMGYLEADSTGNMQYVSLVNKIPINDRNFDDVWKIYDTKEGMVFQTNGKLYVYKGNKFHIIPASTWFHTCFYVNDVLYVRQQEVGLMIMKNGKLELATDGEKFANNLEREIYSMLPYGDSKSLVINFLGLYQYDGKSYDQISKFPQLLPVRCASQLENGNIAVGTISEGMFVMDKQGNILQHIDKSKGLPNNAVLSMFQDQQGNLWLGLENGISYVEINSPFMFFNDKLKINGSAVYSLLHKNKLYVGTNQGLYVANMDEKNNSMDPNVNFTFFTPGEVRGIFEIDGQIICGHHEGAFVIKDGIATKFSDESGGWIFKKLVKKSPYILCGSYFGLSIWENKNGKFTFKNKVKGFHESSRYLEEDEDGNIWMSHANKGIYRITFDEKLDSALQIKFYGTDKGLPSNIRNKVSRIGTEIIFTTDKGVYKYDKTSDRFYEEKVLTNLIGRTYIKGIFPDAIGNLWFIAENKESKSSKKPLDAGVLKIQSNGKYIYEKIPFYKFNNIEIEHIEPVIGDNNPLDTEGVLFSTPEGVIFYDPHFTYKNTKSSYSTILRKVEDINNQDSLIFNGAFSDSNKIAITSQSLSYDFPYISNALRFNVASNLYENIDKTEYQYFMEGLDNRWSAWTSKAQKEYTNLPEGKYVFRARTRNIHGAMGKETTFEFTISAPWYRTYAAYIIYTLFSLFLILVTVKLYTLRLRRLNVRLEDIIQERTKEIQHKNLKLENQKAEIESKNNTLEQNNKDLYELNEEKNYVLEVVSHDLRSPINQIKGIATLFKLTSENLTEEQKENTLKIFKATERLTNMISKILNVNSIESRRIDLQMERVNLAEVVPSVADTFISMAKEKNITIGVSIESKNLYSSIDRNYFAQVLENLVSNALKFSEFNKNVFIVLKETKDKVVLQVKDEGPGISEEDKKKLFGRFQKLSARPTGGEQSIGLGLSIVKKYVEAMNGTVSCESNLGIGTTFIIEFEKLPIMDSKLV
jgi:signal transduction histidine kinase/ligand-binding sensor domain-containing protein